MLIMINGNWEKIEGSDNCFDIVEDNLGREFTDFFKRQIEIEYGQDSEHEELEGLFLSELIKKYGDKVLQ